MSLLQRSKYNPSALFGSCSEQHVHNKIIKLGIFQLLESNHNQDRQDDYKIWLKTDKMIIEYSYRIKWTINLTVYSNIIHNSKKKKVEKTKMCVT